MFSISIKKIPESVQLLKSMGIAFQYTVALTEKADFTVLKRDNPLVTALVILEVLSLSMICRHRGGEARPCKI